MKTLFRFLAPLLTLFPAIVAAEELVLPTEAVAYERTAEAVSCKILRFRAAERAKVLREIEHRMRLPKTYKNLLLANYLLTNKCFLEKEIWNDRTNLVTVTVKLPPELLQEVGRIGFNEVFIGIRGPGVIWRSLGSQFHGKFDVFFDAAKSTLTLRYPIYSSEFCTQKLVPPVVTWVPMESPAERGDTTELVSGIVRGL